jgi:pimeloyl-ACP methyl ester carboxylesterase
LRWIGWIVLVGLLLLLSLVVFLFARESIARGKYRTEYPPPGVMVSLDTHEIHLNCVGSGQPVVIFESDLDQLGSLSWHRVQGEVGEFTRACTYDRAGILWSEPGPRPRDGETIASELGEVLDAAGEEPPYVLVGHAFGGAYVRIFAGQNPAEVCGVVLVESSHPDMIERFSQIGLQKEIPKKQIRPLILFLSHLGFPGRFNGPQYSLPDQVYAIEQAFLPVSSMAWFDESVEAAHTLSQSGRIGDLGATPLIILASGKPTSVTMGGQNLQEIWLELQRNLASLSTNSQIKILPEAGHYLHIDQPQEVIDAIQTIIQQCSPGSDP